MKKTFVMAAVFSFGYVANDLANNRISVVPVAQAEVAGMDYRDLRRDRDFKKAVRTVVSSSCYVDDDTINC